MESLWGVINIVGPLVLLAVIVGVFLYNRRGKRSGIERAERGARELRREIDRDEARNGGA